MISYVVVVLNLFISVFHGVTFCASFLGQLIITVIKVIITSIFQIIHYVFAFIKIVYEDNVVIFTEDLPNFTNTVISTVASQWSALHNVVARIVHHVNYKVCTVTEILKWLFNSVIVMVLEMLTLVKNVLLLIGNTVWFIILFIPVHVVEILELVFQLLFQYLNAKMYEIHLLLLQITNFLTDVPVQSVMGITIGVVILYFCLQFKERIAIHVTLWYYYISHNLIYCYYSLYNYFIDPEIREITLMSTGDIREAEISQSIADVGTESLCVICQERQKCILTLPCRHVCLCSECCLRLYSYQRTCPMCRTFIYHSVTIYL